MIRHYSRILTNNLIYVSKFGRRSLASGGPPIDFPDMGPPIPEYQKKDNEEVEIKRARLLYQSRKRGISENGLLLGNFAAKYLQTFDNNQLENFDDLINKPSNDWDLFYWMLEKDVTPKEFDTPVMDLLKEYCKNEEMEARYQQPELNPVSK